MKTDWQTKKLGEVCDFYNGLWKGKEPPYMHVGVIRNTNITRDGTLDDSDIAYLDVEKKQFSKRKLVYGDIVLEKSGGGPKQPVGRVIIFDKKDGEFSFSNFTSAVRVKDQLELDFNFLHKFLFYSYISGVTEGMQSHSTGIRNLDLHAYKDIEAPVPPIDEQKRLVKTLDEVFEKIEKVKVNTEKNLQNSHDLFKSYLEIVYSDLIEYAEEKKLVEICDIKHGFAFKSQFFLNKGEYVLLTPGNFFEEGGYRDRGDKQKYYIGDIPDGFILNKNDLLVAMTEQAIGLLGSPIIVPESNKLLHNQRLGLITFKDKNKYNVKFFFHLFNTRRIRNLIQATASGVKVRHTSPNKILEIMVSVPNIIEQEVIAKKMESLSIETRKLEEIYRQKLIKLEELKKSILQKAFAGEL